MYNKPDQMLYAAAQGLALSNTTINIPHILFACTNLYIQVFHYSIRGKNCITSDTETRNNDKSFKKPLTQKDPQTQAAEGEETTKEDVPKYTEYHESWQKLDALNKLVDNTENSLSERDASSEQEKTELAEIKQQHKEKESLLAERETQLMDKDNQLQEI